jgi:diamine N-acetyltransferase
MTIRRATLEDIPTIRTIARETWHTVYPTIISLEQIAYMLELMYSEASLRDQMTSKGHRFFMAEKDGRAVGYAGFEHHYQAGINSRLHKLYVLPSTMGTGAGKALLNAVIKASHKAGDTALELNVNKQNPAKDFYLKNGFRIAREEVLDIGEGYVMDDYVMELKIASLRSR